MNNPKKRIATMFPLIAVFISGLILFKAIEKPQLNGLQIAMATVGFLGFLVLFIFSLPFMKKGKPS